MPLNQYQSSEETERTEPSSSINDNEELALASSLFQNWISEVYPLMLELQCSGISILQ